MRDMNAANLCQSFSVHNFSTCRIFFSIYDDDLIISKQVAILEKSSF